MSSPPRRVMFDEDFVTTFELSDKLNNLDIQHTALVDAFVRALRKMKDFEKSMLADDDRCPLCDSINVMGYQCNQWVCEFCFPQVMGVRTRTTHRNSDL